MERDAKLLHAAYTHAHTQTCTHAPGGVHAGRVQDAGRTAHYHKTCTLDGTAHAHTLIPTVLHMHAFDRLQEFTLGVFKILEGWAKPARQGVQQLLPFVHQHEGGH